MERNVGGVDRLARLVGGPIVALLGIGALVGVLPASQVVGVGLFVVGIVLLATGVTRRCLVHRLLGIDTCSRR
ncbi:YgaP family membrane protein [Haloplanus pelagicus]|jgi:hypothetical protein|uniref:YgaP family membrane protein n=1 Tax=Haloplanus pelagicus TaxID=2949995 RepID=UPI00203DCB50|nr:DUF2892 domain-containing protein [Haloplanus sp. HW8-1]